MAAEAVNQENGWMEKHRPEVFGVCQDDVVDIRLHTGPDSSGRMVPPSEPSRGVIDPSNRDLIVESERTIHFQGERQQAVNRPLTLLSCLAHVNLGNPYLNTLWLVVFTALMPALFASLYYGLIPIGNPYGSKRDRMAWVFAVNPCTQVLLSYTIITMFFGVLDESYPWRPFRSYVGILATTYVLQVLCPGLIVLLDETFEMCGLVSVSLTVLVAAMGLYVSNSEKFSDNSDHYYSSLKQFWKVLITFEVFMMVLMLYIVANAKTDGWKQGIVTVSLSIVTFVFKKVLLSLTDPFPLEVAMAIAGLWLENLVDTFIVLAYPTTTDPGPTFAIIWATRVLENVAFLAFQTNAWFTFRVWIKSRFKKDRKIVIRYDLNPDDRGHSNQRPGYRRRQLRFLIWKLLSSASASIFFLCLVPVLRYGWNRDIYPYQDLTEEQMEERYSYVHLKEVLQPLSHSQFRNAMIFTAAQLGTVAVSGVLVWTYMRVFVPTVLTDLFVKYQFLVVSVPYFGFVLTILVSNALLSVTSIQTYARVYWI